MLAGHRNQLKYSCIKQGNGMEEDWFKVMGCVCLWRLSFSAVKQKWIFVANSMRVLAVGPTTLREPNCSLSGPVIIRERILSGREM